MQKFSVSSSRKLQKLKMISIKKNFKKISVGAVLLAVGVSSYVVISTDDSMVSSHSKAVSIASAGDAAYAVATEVTEDATQVADGQLSDVTKSDTAALSSKKATKETTAISISGGGSMKPTEAPKTTQAPAAQAAVSQLTIDGGASGTYLGRFWVTAYCPCSICCGAYSNPANPTTASGATAVEGVTIAAPSSFAFGTQLVVNGHTYTVQDRGGAIAGNRLDIYFSSHQAALNFGAGYYDVYAY